MGEMVKGVRKHTENYVEITDPRDAIAYSLNHGKKHDRILLAGKGHEDYVIIGR